MAKCNSKKRGGIKGSCVAPTLCKAVKECAYDALMSKNETPPAKPGDRTKPARRPNY